MATNQLALYNQAARALGERPLATGEENPLSRVLDSIWNQGNGTIRYCLEQGLWNFALRDLQLDSDAAVDPAFGFLHAFTLPSDFIRINAIADNEQFDPPLNRYEHRGDIIYADIDPLFLSFVSDDAAYGADLSRWPETFTRWVGLYLAVEAAPTIKSDLDMERLEKRKHKALVDARSKDAMNEPARFAPHGSWVNARMRGSSRRDGGSRSNLTG